MKNKKTISKNKKSIEKNLGVSTSATILLSVDRPRGIRSNDTSKRRKGRPFHN